MLTTPPDPLTAPERIAALRASGLLDKTVVQRLDSLAYTATALLRADACQINALDDRFQRTVTGYPPGHWPAAQALEISGCRRVVLLGEPLVIPNVAYDEQVCNQPWTAQFQAYLGVPVRYEGQIVGSMCVLEGEPRDWSTYDVKGLAGLAHLVELSLEAKSA
jgi:GAF domain-containing protein